MTEINKKLDLAAIPPTNNDGDPYILPLDIFKEGYSAYNISNWFKGRVGDNGTPFAIRWYSHGRLLNIQGMRPFIEGQVGDYTIDDSDPDNVRIDMAEDASNIHIVGDVDDTQAGGVAIYRLINQAFPKSGIFYGKIGFMGTQDDGTLVNTGVDVVFKVLAGHMNMMGARQFYVSELEKAWLDLQEKIRQYDQEYSDKIKQQDDKFKQETEQALQDLRTKVSNEIQHAEDNLQGVQVTSNTVLDELNRLSQSIGQVQAQIDAGNVVTRKEHHNDIATLQQYLSNQEASMTKTLTGISKSGPYFFANLAELQSLYPNGHDGILVTRDNLHWCYWESNQKQYIDCGKFTDSNNSDINIDELSMAVANNQKGIRSAHFGYSAYHDLMSTYNPDADQKLDLTKKVLIPQVFTKALLGNSIVYITSITVKPYQEGKLEIGVAHPYGPQSIKFKTSQIVELTTTDIQTIPINNLELRTGDYLTIAGPVSYSLQKEGSTCGVIDKVGTTPLTGIHDEETDFGAANFSFYVTVGIPETSSTLFPSRFLGKTIPYQNKEFYDENASKSFEDTEFKHNQFLIPPAFKDNGIIKRIYYCAPDNGYITLGTANVWGSDNNNWNARIHNNIRIKVTKGKGQANIYLPFFANDYLIVGGQVCFMQNATNDLSIGNDRDLIVNTQNVAGNATFDMWGADYTKGVKLNIYFDTEIADYSHNDLIEKEIIDPKIDQIVHPFANKKYACLGDSIWSDQVAGIGTIVQKDLNAQMIGNFAVGWATCQDWFDSGKNITPITFNVPNNTDTADNVLSNQVRRMLQWTTEKDQIIKWQHPVDGWFNIDGDAGMGLGHTDDIPDVIGIAISTNDGKHDQCGNLADDTNEVFQQHYKDLTRNSIASALRWAIETLQAAYPNCKIYICTPLQTNGGNSWMSYQNNLKKAEIIKKVGAFCSVPIIDQFSESGLNSQTVVHGTADGIHPTGEMKNKIAEFDARQIEKKY